MRVCLGPGFSYGSAGKESTCNAGDLALIPGLGRSPGEGKGYQLQHSGLENSMQCTVHWVTKSWTGLSDFHFTSSYLLLWARIPQKKRSSHHSQQKSLRCSIGCTLKNDRMISVRFQGKPFNVTVIQVYAPTSNAEEAEVEWYYEDLQDLLELTLKKTSFSVRGLECKSRTSRNTWSNRQIWPWSTE